MVVMSTEYEKVRFEETDPIAPDFEPLYALERSDYQVVVNSFFNLTMTTVRTFKELGAAEAAQAVAEQARSILLAYDEDLADLILREAVPRQEQLDDEVPWE